MLNIALSTMWMRGRFARPRDFFLAGQALGFHSFEVTEVATPAFYDDIHPGEFIIQSLHDPAPLDVQSAELRRDGIMFTSLDEEKRQRAVAMAKRSVDIAHRYGARAVILHLGRSEADPALQKQLEQLFAEERIHSPEADALRALQVEQRRSHYDEIIAALFRSLDELVPYAAAREIRLGMENRRYTHEIPNFEEMALLLRRYDDDTIGYWHDVGHAETQAAVGMASQADWLRAFGSRLVGMHIHDVNGFTDHRAPGTGHVAWQELAALLPDHALRTAEINSSTPEETIRESMLHLQAVGWVKA